MRRQILLVALLAVHAVIPLMLVAGSDLDTASFVHRSDAARYLELAREPADQLRASPPEYPPLAVALFDVLEADRFRTFVVRLLVLQVVLDAALAALLWRVWGRDALVWYLALSAPLLPIVLTKFDLLPAVLAVGGVAAVTRLGRDRLGGALVGVAAFAKIWPVVLLPLFAARRRWRAVTAGAATSVVGLVVWSVRAGGAGGLIEGGRGVLTFRDARGWHVESGPGVLLGIAGGGIPRFEAGSWRVGDPPALARAAVVVLLVAALVAVWHAAWRAGTRAPEGVAECGTVAAMLAFAVLASPQFLVWLAPFAAIAAATSGARATVVPRAAAAAVGLTALAAALWDPSASGSGGARIVLLARGVALVAVWAAAVRVLAAARVPGTEPATAVAAATGNHPAETPEAISAGE
jgi:hypothetical protein